MSGKEVSFGGRTWRLLGGIPKDVLEMLEREPPTEPPPSGDVPPEDEGRRLRVPKDWRHLEGLRVDVDGNPLTLTVGQYANGRLALQAFTMLGEMECTVTVNIPEWPVGPKQLLVPRQGLPARIVGYLVATNVVRSTGEVVPSGYVQRYAEKWELV